MIAAALALAVTCTTPGITDGDTIRCGGERVRLWGLDAPERFTAEGPAATRAMADLTRGRTVTCTEAGPRSYGRLVARCLTDRTDLACEMIRLGVAVEYLKFSRGFYRACKP